MKNLRLFSFYLLLKDMFLINCLPFSKGLNKESLSYFGPKYLKPGSLIKINIRGKNLSALVLESKNIVETKAEIKAADFKLKKISAFSAKPFLQEEFFESIKDTSEYFVSPSSGILTHLIPAFILENPEILSTLKEHLTNKKELTENVKSEVSALQAPEDERYIHYRSLIREEFAKKKSIFLCLPQNEDIKQAKERLERGIETYVCTFHKEMNVKELKKEWKKAVSTSHPILIIATGRWLFIPRDDIGTIIIDKENSNGWKTLSRPFIDLRFFAEILASKKNSRFIIGDSFLRTETLYRYKKGEISEFENVKWRLLSEVKTSIIDLKKNAKKGLSAQAEKEFKTVSLELHDLIRDTIEKGSHMFIFAARKGLSPITICRDCGEQVKCSNCGSPVVLYKIHPAKGGESSGAFKCHQCGETRDAAEVCQNCHSWKLTAFGSGIDRIAEEIKKEHPDIKFFEIHRDVISASIKATNIIEDFYKNRGAILLGTEMAFSYLNKKVTNSAIASFDSLFSIPDFRIREKIFSIILQTRDSAKKNFLIQSHNPEDQTIKLATTGNLADFYKIEMEDRETLGYPPFGIFIKITIRGTRNFTIKETEKIKTILQDWNPAIFPSVHEKKGEQLAINIVIKMSRENWPNNDLKNILKLLPPHFEIKIDPDNIL